MPKRVVTPCYAICGNHASDTLGRAKRLQVDSCYAPNNKIRELLCYTAKGNRVPGQVALDSNFREFSFSETRANPGPYPGGQPIAEVEFGVREVDGDEAG